MKRSLQLDSELPKTIYLIFFSRAFLGDFRLAWAKLVYSVEFQKEILNPILQIKGIPFPGDDHQQP